MQLLRNEMMILAVLAVTACQSETVAVVPNDTGDSSAMDAQVLIDAQDSGITCEDLDSDGFCTDRDCDDQNAAIHPGAPEACNQQDDNCNDEIDENLGMNRCGLGPCARELPNCVDGKPSVCTPGEPQIEVCNGIDDDCNGAKDDNISATMSCGIGACTSSAACENGAWAMCVPGMPIDETCNRADDNCDGTIDEGFRAEYVYSTYSALAVHQPGCDGAGQRIGLTCSSAMNRFCAAKDCTTSGFGPLENSGDIAHVACVQADVINTTFTDLAMKHAGCNGVTQRFGPDCGAAIHRFCADQGYVSGYGPVEHNQDAAGVACVSSDVATAISTNYTELSMHHAPCNGVAERFGPNCFAAISRYCRAQGHTTGYGPVENFGDSATIFCIDP